MLRDSVRDIIKTALPGVGEIHLEHPESVQFGDFSTNIAMQMAGREKKNSQELAGGLKETLSKNDFFEKVEVAGPGFLNLFLAPHVLLGELGVILEGGDSYGNLSAEKKERMNIEFFSANPTGEPHIGNGRGAFYGDALSRVLKKAGHDVTREYYIQNAEESNQIKELGKTALGKGNSYRTDYLIRKIEEHRSKNIEGDPARTGRIFADLVTEDIKELSKEKLGIYFDEWISENTLYEKGEIEKMHALLKEKGLVYERDGAEWAKTSEFGAPEDRVIVRSDGTPTYLLPDLAYHADKFARGFGRAINVWGADHQGHVKDMQALLKALWPEKKVEFLITQMAHIKGGVKLSKRKGEVITLKWLLDEVGVDAARFFYLMKSLDTQMEFDVELAREKSQKNPVYYVQYAHARIHSILAKSEIRNPKSETNSKSKFQNSNLDLLSHQSELALIRELAKFPEIVEDTANDYGVQRIPHYAIKLADLFHRLYHDCRVLGDDKKLTESRLALVRATKIVIKNTLDLLGVSAPERM